MKRRLIPYAGAEPAKAEAQKPDVPIYSPLERLILAELGGVCKELARATAARDRLLRRLDAVRKNNR